MENHESDKISVENSMIFDENSFVSLPKPGECGTLTSVRNLMVTGLVVGGQNTRIYEAPW